MTLTVSAALQLARSGDRQSQLAISHYYFEHNDLASARLWAGRAADAGLRDALLPAAQLELLALAQAGRLAVAEQRAREAVAARVGDAAPVLAKIRILRSPDLDAGLAEAAELLVAQTAHRSLGREIEAILALRASRSESAPERPAGEPTSLFLHVALLPESSLRCLEDLALPLLRPAMVVDPRTGQRALHPIRRGEQAVLDWQRLDPIAAAVLRIVAEAAGCDWRCCEPINLLRYPVGGEYRMHHDCFEFDPLALAPRSAGQPLNQRATTALLYLNDDLSGGATAFPEHKLELAPRRNHLLVFENLRDGNPDPAMRHAGMPVLSGEKRVLSFWFREHPLIDASDASVATPPHWCAPHDPAHGLFLLRCTIDSL